MKQPPWHRYNGSRFKGCTLLRRNGALRCSAGHRVDWVRTMPGSLPPQTHSTLMSLEQIEPRSYDLERGIFVSVSPIAAWSDLTSPG
jgi:hypothetical protein